MAIVHDILRAAKGPLHINDILRRALPVSFSHVPPITCAKLQPLPEGGPGGGGNGSGLPRQGLAALTRVLYIGRGTRENSGMNITQFSLALPGLGLGLVLALAAPHSLEAAPDNPDTDWFKDAQYGAFMHFLPGSEAGLAQVASFDVEAVARQLTEMGAKYFIITLGQNSGYFISPNATYDRMTGYAPGERCSRRDLPLELFRALQPRGIRLMLYLPCQVPNGDARAQRAFGLPEGGKDQPLTLEFAGQWSRVIQEWSDRYADKVSGWWFDGGYAHIHFNEQIARAYAAAAKHGNPKSLVTFNPGVRVIDPRGRLPDPPRGPAPTPARAPDRPGGPP